MEGIPSNILVQILGAKAGIKVKIYGGSTFATNGNEIFVPSWVEKLPTDVMLGFVAHEAVGHIRMTDFEVGSQIPLVDSVLNLLEDIRIESKIPLVYPGARRLLAETAAYAGERFWLLQEDDGRLNIDQPFFWLMRRLRTDLLEQLGDDANRQRLADIEAFLQRQGRWDKCQQALSIALQALKTCEKTGDLLPAAKQIAYLFAQQESRENPNQGNQESAQSPQNPADSGQGGQDIDPSILQHKVCIDLCEALCNGTPTARVQKLHKAKDLPPFRLRDQTTPEERMQGMRIANLMRSGLQDALRRLLEDEDNHHVSAGRFDPRMAVAAYHGWSRDVFLEEGEEAPGLDMRLMLLIDASGSMKKMEKPMRSMIYGIVQALGSIPEVDLGLTYYSHDVLYQSPRGASRQVLLQAARGYEPYGGTCWSSAFFGCLPWFYRGGRQRTKNVLITFTDGDVDADQLGASMQLLRKQGLECRFLVKGDGTIPDTITGNFPVVRLKEDATPGEVARSFLELLRDSLVS